MNDLLAALVPSQRRQVLRFTSSFLWANLEMLESERAFFRQFAFELGGFDESELGELLRAPPRAEDVDPNDVAPELADSIRQAALRAIAADGRVLEHEMSLFHLLDELLPRGSPEAAS